MGSLCRCAFCCDTILQKWTRSKRRSFPSPEFSSDEIYPSDSSNVLICHRDVRSVRDVVRVFILCPEQDLLAPARVRELDPKLRLDIRHGSPDNWRSTEAAVLPCIEPSELC